MMHIITVFNILFSKYKCIVKGIAAEVKATTTDGMNTCFINPQYGMPVFLFAIPRRMNRLIVLSTSET